MSEKQDVFRFAAHDTIGASDAEHDASFLADCFVETGDLAVLMDCTDPRCVVLGRVGVGKSALLERIRQKVPERSIALAPEKLALSHLVNSDILRFAHDVGAELNVFFKLLWRHVIAIEILSVRFDIDSESAVTQLFDRLSHKGRRRVRAMEYLQKWGPTFWKESDYRIKEITNRLEREVEAGAGVGPITAKMAANLTTEERIEVRQRVQHIVNQGQVRELSEILTLLDDVLDDPQKRYFVLVDKLDEGWVHDALRFRLIRALVETARDFSSVRHAKVVLTMRTDLYREMLARTQESGFQREKHETNLLSPRWTKAQLREVLDRRVATLVARRYTSARVGLDDIFYASKSHRDDPIGYILARTLMRPRDAIQYLNKIIQSSNDKARITLKAITAAETEYSRGRIDSIVDEWSASWPSLPCLIALLPRGQAQLRISELEVNELVVRIFEDLRLSSFEALPMSDPLARAVHEYYAAAEKNVTPSDVGIHRAIVEMLYDAGIIGVHFGKENPQYSYEYPLRRMDTSELKSARLPYHKTFFGYFDVPAP